VHEFPILSGVCSHVLRQKREQKENPTTTLQAKFETIYRKLEHPLLYKERAMQAKKKKETEF